MDAGRSDRLVIYPSRVKLALGLVGAIAFVALGLWMASPANAQRVKLWQLIVASYVGVPFFAAGGLLAAYRLAVRRPALEIDSAGITDAASAFGGGRLGWDEVDHVVLYKVSGQAMLGIIPKDAEAYVRRLRGLRKAMARLNLTLGTPPVNIAQGALPMTVAELADTLHRRYHVRVVSNP